MKKLSYILFVICSLAFILTLYFDNPIIYSLSKPLPLIILISLINWEAVYNKLIIIGFMFSLIGDILLMKTIDVFLYGLIAFLIAHVFYIIAFTNKCKKISVLSSIPFYLYGIIFYIFLYDSLGEMAIPVAFYILIITTMLWRSFVQRKEGKMSNWAFWGALLFVISDSMIAFTKFHKSFYLAPLLVMLTYWGGQFLIYWSTTKPQAPASTPL